MNWERFWDKTYLKNSIKLIKDIVMKWIQICRSLTHYFERNKATIKKEIYMIVEYELTDEWNLC